MGLEIGSSPNSIVKRWTGGMQFLGRVTAVPGANQFTIPTLAGFPAGMFADATAPYYAMVVWDAGGAGAAPQGQKKVLTGYVSATGVFTAPGFAPAVGIGDWVRIIDPMLPTIEASAAISIASVDAVYIDTCRGSAGVGDNNGLPQNPSSGVASEVKDMLSARNLGKVKIKNGAFSVDVDLPAVEFEGRAGAPNNAQVNLDGIHTVAGSVFKNLYLIGAILVDDYIVMENSTLAMSTPAISLSANNLRLMGGTSCVAKTWWVDHCSVLESDPLGPTLISFDPAGTHYISFANWSGKVHLGSMLADQWAKFSGQGIITLDATCTGGDLYVDEGIQVIDLSGGLVTVHKTGGNTKLIYEGVVSAVPGANQFTIADLAGIPAGMLVDAANPWSAYVKHDKGGAGAAPQGEIKVLTGATNAGVFTTGAFTAAVAVGDIVQIVHPLLAATISLSTAAAKIWKQADSVDVNITAILASETNVLNLPAAANTTYRLEHLRLKVADPGVNTVYVRLYEEVNGALTLVNTKNVDAANFANYFSLMDLFSLSQSVGNNIKVTVQTSAGGPYAVTANYSYATATV